jgi:hypothetical protein
MLGVLLGFMAGRMPRVVSADSLAGNEAPLKIVEVSITEDNQEVLFEQIRKYAESWQYAIRIAPTTQNSEKVLIQMWREDIKVIGLYPSDPGELKMGFYYTNPAVHIPELFFDKEIRNLETFIQEIPNATFTIKD